MIQILLVLIIFWLIILLNKQKQQQQQIKQKQRQQQKRKKEIKNENNEKEKENKIPINILSQSKTQEILIKYAQMVGGNNIVTRHSQNTAAELDFFDRNTPLTRKSYKFGNNEARCCYGCGRATRRMHPVYIFSCKKCGTKFQKYRYLTRNLEGQVSLVIGCRTKLGHQVSLKLLRAGSIVIGTTRYPEKATNLFQEYEDYNQWKNKFDIYKKGLDLDSNQLENKIKELTKYISNQYNKLDNLIICAAQTIRVREKDKENVLSQTTEFNRYGDAKFVEEKYINSWQMTIKDITQEETEECMRINAVAPALLIQSMIDIMKKSENTPYIICVHAREGIFTLEKSPKHIHTNMAKAALHMMTRTLIEDKSLITNSGKHFSIHGCDPGWISVDEYYENKRPFIIPPLDEIDGAARILHPLFLQLPSSRQTRRQFDDFAY